MTVYEMVRQAIVDKAQVIATYQGHVRHMCPHVIGRAAKGNRQALFFQFAGGSTTGLPPGGQWRCIPIDGLKNVSVREGPWHTASDHTRPQTCVEAIDVEVRF